MSLERIMKLRKTKAVQIGALLIVGAILAGCANSSSAANMKHGSVSISNLQSTIHAIVTERTAANTMPENALTGADLVRAQLRLKIISFLLHRGASEKGIIINPAEVAANREKIITQIGGEAALPAALANASIAASDLDRYIEDIIIQDSMRAKLVAPTASDQDFSIALQKYVSEIGARENVKLNPRYGVWVAATSDINPVDASNGAVADPAK
jgi:outer membrane murein-binding lipoprotein Lpp